MHQSKLLSIIRTMDADAMREALTYLKNNHADGALLPLFKHIKKYRTTLDHNNLSKRKVFSVLSPNGGKYDEKADKAVRVRMSYLTKALEDFLVQQMLKEDTLTRQRLLARYYGRSDNYDLFEEVVQAQIKSLEDHPRSDMEYQLERWTWHHEWFFHPSTPKIPNLEALKMLMTSLDQFFVLAKLRYSADVFIIKKVVSEDFPIELLQEILNHSETQQFYNNPVIELYSYLLQMQLNTPDEEKFKKCIDLLETNLDKIEKYEKAFIINALTNYAGYCQNKGLTKYRRFVLVLYKFAIQQNTLLDKNKLKSNAFINIVAVGAAEKDFDWTFNFIHQFGLYLFEQEKKEFTQLALAYWHYHHGLFTKDEDDFDRALIYLREIPFSSVEIDLRIRSLEIRILYEQDDANLLEYAAKRFIKYLERHPSIALEKGESYRNFISFALKLKEIEPFKKSKLVQIKKLKTKILELKVIVLKPWLLEKVEELLKIPPKY